MKYNIFLSIFILVMAACGSNARKERIGELPSHKDFGAINVFQECKAAPRRTLSGPEACEIALISKTCTPAADCLVTCQVSPDGYKFGGGCYHICFGEAGGHRWEEQPNVNLAVCHRDNDAAPQTSILPKD